MCIVQPSNKVVFSFVKKWKTLEKYVLQERSLNKLFAQTYPRNEEMDDVLIKISSLNDFYSTNIFYPVDVAKHIVNLKIDQRLAVRDLTLVNDIARVKLENQTTKCFFSFATKYCSHHDADYYPIYDKFVVKMLMHFKRTDQFCSLNDGLRCYPSTVLIVQRIL